MNPFQNIGIKEYFNRYGIKYGLYRAFFLKFPIHIVNDYEFKKVLYYRIIRLKIEKRFKNAIDINPKGLSFGCNKLDNPIWVYWKQGENNMPDLVKKCYESIKKNATSEVVLITDENISQYVRFPEFVTRKLSSRNMSTAAFSDLLRFTLLEHYGGTWIDATVYLSSSIPDYMVESDLFSFQDKIGSIDNPALMSVWFLHSNPGNLIIKKTRNIAFQYWKTHNYVMEYLIPYIFITYVLERYPKIKKSIPYANSDYCRLMFDNLGEKYTEKRWKYITSLSSVHKLSYKLKKKVYLDKNNMYNHILKI